MEPVSPRPGGKRAKRGAPVGPEPPELLEEDDENARAEEDSGERRLRDAVLKLIVTHVEPNYSLPWQQRRQTSSTSTAFLISERRILTNAHCVENATVVRIKKRGDDRKFIASVVMIGRECDLALLSVADESFFIGLEPIALGRSLPRLQDTVTVVGYPVGGDNQSITQGVVSRIDLNEYSHGGAQLLCVQIDAAINSGNSGGPVLAAAPPACVGIAFQSVAADAAENIGFLIPVPVVERFLADHRQHGRYTGFASVGFDVQLCENPSLRAFSGLGKGDSGVRIMKVHPLCAEARDGRLRAGDIMCSFDSVPIANDGTIAFKHGEQRISWRYLLSQKFVGDVAELRLVRDGQRLPPLTLTLHRSSLLVPTTPAAEGAPAAADAPAANGGSVRPAAGPSYFIVGGLVFVTLSEAFLRSEYGDDWESKAPIMLMERLVNGLKAHARDEVVVLSQVLAHTVNIGYEGIVNCVVGRLNGEAITDLRHLVQLVRGNKKKYLHFELPPWGEAVVLDAKEARKAEAAILAQHSIPSAVSPDLLLNATATAQLAPA